MTKVNNHDPDAQLVKRAQRGDEWAFGKLVEEHQAKLFTLAARTLGSDTDAADAVQEALIRAWVSLPRFRGASRFSTWLYRITLNAAHDQRLKRGHDPSEVAVEKADPRDLFVESELSGQLQQTLAVLDEDFRLAVVLYDVLGCPYDEIAQLTDVPEGTVKSRIYRGRKELARLLGTPAAQTESKQQ